MTFDSIGEAYDFYNLYLCKHGFGIKYGKSRLNSEKTKCEHGLCKRLRCWRIEEILGANIVFEHMAGYAMQPHAEGMALSLSRNCISLLLVVS